MDSHDEALRIPSRAGLRRSPLGTERLLLVPIDAADGADLWRVVSGSRAALEPWLPWVHHCTGPGWSARFAGACAIEWDRGISLRFVLRARASGALLGMISLESCDHCRRSCDLGYWLRREAMGRGIVTEAARAAIGFAFLWMGAHRVRAAAAVGNHPSLRVLRRLGFRFEGIVPHAELCQGRWLDHATFSLSAPHRG
jgi:ribosomal-protein-serine acetyltransferase